jgi:hypothetical protein
MWEPSGAIERWGGLWPAVCGSAIFGLAALVSLVVGWCFYRDYHDGSPVTRGYFLTLMWKRVGMAGICASHLVMFLDVRAGLIGLYLAGLFYIAMSVVFLVVWARRGRHIRRSADLSYALNREGLDVDSMTPEETTSQAKQWACVALDKAAASLSNIHHAH